MTCAEVQQHWSPPPPSPELSLIWARSQYSPGALKVAVVTASRNLLASPPFISAIVSSAIFTSPGPRYFFQRILISPRRSRAAAAPPPCVRGVKPPATTRPPMIAGGGSLAAGRGSARLVRADGSFGAASVLVV